MTADTVRIWGSLQPDFDTETIRTLIELFDFPSSDADRSYVYTIEEPEFEQKKTDDVRTILDDVESSAQLRIGSLRSGHKPQYKDLSVNLQLLLSDETFRFAPSYHISLPGRLFEPSSDDTISWLEAVDQLVDLGTEMYRAADAFYSFGFPEFEGGSYSPEHYPKYDSIRSGSLPPVYWFNVFDPELVNAVGQERIESCSAWKISRLDDGSMVVVAWQDPTEMGSDQGHTVERELGLNQ
jgi:hypothetical protein